jgi:hypothetical protein
MRQADVHQHLWTRSLLDALARRQALPLVRHSGGLTVLHSAGERACVIDVAAEAPERRAALVRADGLDFAVIAISSPIGIESLPRDEALELIDAHLAGVSALGAQFAAWGPVPLDRPQPDDVDDVLACGALGVSVESCSASSGTSPRRSTSGSRWSAIPRKLAYTSRSGTAPKPARG